VIVTILFNSLNIMVVLVQVKNIVLVLQMLMVYCGNCSSQLLVSLQGS
jgi:hypothetical protein